MSSDVSSDGEEFKSETSRFSFRGPHAWRLAARVWKTSEPNRKACVFGIHGYTEHSGRYGHFAKFLNDAGYDYLMMDLPGHGLSEGRRANIDYFEDYVESLESFFRAGKLLGHKGPYLLFGHSLGGLIAIRFLQSSSYARDFSKAFLSSPLLGLAEQAFYGVGRLVQSEIGLKALHGVSRLLPNLTLSNERDLGGLVLTHDDKLAAAREADSLVKPEVTVHWTREFIKARNLAFKEVESIQIPLAIFQAGDDRVVSSTEPERFIQKLGHKDKLFRVYKDLYHEILNETCRTQVMREMLYWMEASPLSLDPDPAPKK